MKYNTMPYHNIQWGDMQYTAIISNTIQCHVIQYNEMSCNTLQCNRMKQDHQRWGYSTVTHMEQPVYLAIWKDKNKKEKKRTQKIDWTIEMGRMVERFLFLLQAFAPSALRLEVYKIYFPFLFYLFVNFRQYPNSFRPFLDISWPFPDIFWQVPDMKITQKTQKYSKVLKNTQQFKQVPQGTQK